MKIRIISDVITESIKSEILKNSSYDVESLYTEDLLAFFMNREQNIASADFDCLIIHSDQLFHKKPVEWQRQLIQNVIEAGSILIGKKIFLSNLFNASFRAESYKQEINSIYDSLNIYSDLFNRIKQQSNIFIFDAYNIICELGKEQCYNYVLGHLYQMPYKKNVITAFALTIISLLEFIESEEKKVIVLDCDNTLWNGIIGEDGCLGVKCDKNAEGILFYHFQEFLKTKKDEGFLLALCSKNNENDVREFFQQRQMPLQWDDFIVKKINWKEKHENLKEIAYSLNLGLDSFIFVDDNPYEISLVSNFIPEITCIEMKHDYEFFEKLRKSMLFRRKNITALDREKTNLYITEYQRKEAANRFENFDSFLESLNIKVEIKKNDTSDLVRLAQMTEKTNQFNFNKVAYTVQQLDEFIGNGNFIFSMKVSDKFGDYGTVGLILVEKIKGEEVRLKNCLMSCRVLGKKIEWQFFDFVINYLHENAMKLVEILFRETGKNIIAKEFLNKTAYGNIVKTVI
jgi:FkbH-like protein